MITIAGIVVLLFVIILLFLGEWALDILEATKELTEIKAAKYRKILKYSVTGTIVTVLLTTIAQHL